MKLVKKLAVSALCAVLTLSSFGISAETKAAEYKAGEAPAPVAADFESLEPVTIMIASAAASANNIYKIMDELCQEITAATDGKLNFDLVWDGALGSDLELINSCIMGDVDIAFVATSSFSNTCREMAIFDAPGLFTSVVDATKVDIQMTSVLDPYMNKVGLKVLAFGCNNFRGLSTNIELRTPEDFKGMKIRTPENKYFQAFYSNLGCQPTPLPFPELYTALQQGLVDAQDNPAEAVYATKFYEVQDYFMDPQAISYVFPTVINLDRYNALDPAYQEALVYFGEEYARRCADGSAQVAIDSLKAMEGQITELELTEDIHNAIVKAGEPILDMIRADIGDEVVDQYLQFIAELDQ